MSVSRKVKVEQCAESSENMQEKYEKRRRTVVSTDAIICRKVDVDVEWDTKVKDRTWI